MRAWVGPPQTMERAGTRLIVANRNDGFSVLFPDKGFNKAQMDSYLDELCTCDSTKPGNRCKVHREVGFA